MGNSCCSEFQKAAVQQIPVGGDDAVVQATPRPIPAYVKATALPAAEARPPDVGQAAHQDQLGNPQRADLPPGPDRSDGSRTGTADGSDAGSKEQRQQAKATIKEFVKEMVRGKDLNVMTQSGQLKMCTASLSRGLNVFRIKVGAHTRSIELPDIDKICVGQQVEGVSTPLDEFCVTLMLASEDCITFRFDNHEARDVFAACLHMICNSGQ